MYVCRQRTIRCLSLSLRLTVATRRNLLIPSWRTLWTTVSLVLDLWTGDWDWPRRLHKILWQSDRLCSVQIIEVNTSLYILTWRHKECPSKVTVGQSFEVMGDVDDASSRRRNSTKLKDPKNRRSRSGSIEWRYINSKRSGRRLTDKNVSLYRYLVKLVCPVRTQANI